MSSISQVKNARIDHRRVLAFQIRSTMSVNQKGATGLLAADAVCTKEMQF